MLQDEMMEFQFRDSALDGTHGGNASLSVRNAKTHSNPADKRFVAIRENAFLSIAFRFKFSTFRRVETQNIKISRQQRCVLFRVICNRRCSHTPHAFWQFFHILRLLLCFCFFCASSAVAFCFLFLYFCVNFSDCASRLYFGHLPSSSWIRMSNVKRTNDRICLCIAEWYIAALLMLLLLRLLL